MSEVSGVWEQALENSWGPGAELCHQAAAGRNKTGPLLKGPSDWRSHQNLGPNRSVLYQQQVARSPSSKPEFCGGTLTGRGCEEGSPEA